MTAYDVLKLTYRAPTPTYPQDDGRIRLTLMFGRVLVIQRKFNACGVMGGILALSIVKPLGV